MKVHYPKLYNMAYLLSLNVFTASKGSNSYILFNSYQQKQSFIKWIHWKFLSLMLTIFVFNHFLNEPVLGGVESFTL